MITREFANRFAQEGSERKGVGSISWRNIHRFSISLLP